MSAAASAVATRFNSLMDMVFPPYPLIWTEDNVITGPPFTP